MSEVKLYVKGREGGLFADATRPATDDEIKAAHPKCRTCSHCGLEIAKCDHPDNAEYDDSGFCTYEPWVDPDLDYCRHHTPREWAEGREGGQG